MVEDREKEGGKKSHRKEMGYRLFPDVNRIGRPKAVPSIPILLGHYRQLQFVIFSSYTHSLLLKKFKFCLILTCLNSLITVVFFNCRIFSFCLNLIFTVLDKQYNKNIFFL